MISFILVVAIGHFIGALAMAANPGRRRLFKSVCGGLIGLFALRGGRSAPGIVPITDDESEPTGTWYLVANGFRLTVTIALGERPGAYGGTLAGDDAAPLPLDDITWDPTARVLAFRRDTQWYRGAIVQGVLVGRFAMGTQVVKPPVAAYIYHVTGWNSDYFDRDIAPRVYEIVANGVLRGRLRIDRAAGGSYTGRLKYYAKSSLVPPAAGEELEYDVDIPHWDGTNLRFVRRDPAWTETYTGRADGRGIAGTFTRTDWRGTFAWSGNRAEVLGYGLVSKPAAVRSVWQENTRRQLLHLMMAGNPASETVHVTMLSENRAPSPGPPPLNRDDAPQQWPPGPTYDTRELQFDHTIPDPYGGPAIARRSHAWLALPRNMPPGAKYPAVLALNGHGGSAWSVFDPSDEYHWFGDAFARRGYIVLAVDIGHRPCNPPLYNDLPDGDDPAHGNGPHPAVTAPVFAPYASCTMQYGEMVCPDMQSDWEEDGERAWDAMRALDYLLARPDVDPDNVTVTGLSLGGEMATWVAALDPRLGAGITAGYSPDMGVLLNLPNAHACWRWNHADIREYLDQSDLHALIAPRLLIVQTGKQDPNFSMSATPFAADKQVARRTRAAYGDDAGSFVHYLHYDFHHYHVGGEPPDPENPPPNYQAGVQVPRAIAPQSRGSLTWQTDGTTTTDQPTVFDYLSPPQ
jgi:dienelactone hydrolase